MVTRDRDTDANGTLDERLFALQDANWNTTALVNISGTVVERDTYSPFGVATYRDASGSVISTSAKDWVFLHQGGEKIAAGDYDFRNRIYSPTLGRWLSNDPIGFSAGDVNTYRYVGNGPTSLLDPMGLEDKKKWPWWWPKLIGSSNGSKAEDDEGGTYIGEIVDIRADFQHKGGAHYDVDYLEAYTGNPKVRTQRYWRDGTPFTDNENDRINRGLPAKGGNYTGVTRQNGDIRSLPFPVYGGQEIVSSPFPALRDNGMIQTPFPKFGENGKLIYDPPPIKVDPGLITPFPNEQDIGIHRESSSVNVGEYLPTPRQIVDGGIAFGSGAAIGYGILIVGGVVSAPALGPPAAIVTAGAALFFLLRGEDSFNPYDGAGGI
jgi:RHS repeat-associated protein